MNQSTTGAVSTGDPTQKVTLRLADGWGQGSSSDLRGIAFDKVIKAFEAKYPNITIDRETTDYSTYQQSIILKGNSPNPPDIMMLETSGYPHMTVGENMAFALKLRGIRREERKTKVREAARMLDLEKYLDRKPKALSGGQRQRVAMGRAIVREPAVFLMDEPLSNLDAKLRVETRGNIAELQARLRTTTVYVTHDQVEAMTLGHRVAVLRDGVLQQADTPRHLYDKPANEFVAGFIGSPAMNLRRAPLVGTGAQLQSAVLPLPDEIVAAAARAGLTEITVGLRPEACGIGGLDAGPPLHVSLVEELGSDAYVYGRLAGDPAEVKPFVVRVDGAVVPQPGDTVGIRMAGPIHAFDPNTGHRL